MEKENKRYNQESYERSPYTRVSFRPEDRGRAWNSAAKKLPTIGLPGNVMIADIRRLQRIKAAGLSEVYLGPYKEDGKPVSVDTVIDFLRSAQKKIDNR